MPLRPWFSSVQLLSRVQLFATPWTAAHEASLSITNSQSLLKLSVHCVSNAIQPSPPLSSPSPPAFNLFQCQGLFQQVSSWHQVTKVLEFQLQHQSFQWIFRTDLLWDGWVAVQGTLKSLFQHHSSKASILQHSAYMTTGKTIALTRRMFVGKVMSLLFNMLSRLVITFLPRSKCLLIPWLKSPSAVILEPPKNKVCHCFHCFPIYLPWIRPCLGVWILFWAWWKPQESVEYRSDAVRFVFENASDGSREKRWRGARMEGCKVVDVDRFGIRFGYDWYILLKFWILDMKE